MAKIYFIEGPVGAGKSTFATNLSQEKHAPHLNLDAWMTTLFRADRPSTNLVAWYTERKERCIAQIWETARKILDANCDVILELGLIQRENRYAMYKRVQECRYDSLVYVLDVPRDIRWDRVQKRNAEKGDTFSMEVSREVFEFASNMWEAPDPIEVNEQNIEFISYLKTS